MIMGILVTGGAGFIGSHLVDRLMEGGHSVRVFDNLSSGSLDNLRGRLKEPGFEFIEGDLLDPGEVEEALEGCDTVYHLAANPEVRAFKASPRDHFEQNVEATYNMLEAVRSQGRVGLFAFASTSTVYGEAGIIPTPEEYGPMKPISLYGASKLAGEALVSAYASMHGFRGVIYRLANVIGPRSNHGVVYDFVEKLKRNPRLLEVLGDGTQSKSYLYVEDCVEGMILGAEKASGRVETFNMGSEDRVDVLTIAEAVKEEMGLGGAEVRLTGGVDGGRGWRGDVKTMQLDTSRLRRLGWEPRFTSAEAIRKTAKALTTFPR